MVTQVFERDIPVKYDVDVFVAGGGPAGVSAAVIAARMGCSVYLAEAQGCLGGQGTAGGVPCFMQFTDGINFLAGGIGEEILTNLKKEGGIAPDVEGDHDYRIEFRVEVLKRVYDDLLLNAGVNFTFNTNIIALEAKDGKVESVILSAKSGLFAVKAKIYIDCTGDGDLAVWAGAPFEKGDDEGNMQPGTLCSLWSDIAWEIADRNGIGKEKIIRAIEEKATSIEDRHLPGMLRVGRHTGGGNIGHAYGVDGTDEVSVTKAYIDSRKLLLEYERFYKKYMNGYDKMELIFTAPMMGIRETRRIIGDYVLNLEDFRRQAVFEDEIGRYAYPVDIHASKSDLESFKKFKEAYLCDFRYKPGESYGIPYRALLPKGLSNMFVAGRCISTDRHMQGSIRVMPGCFITGQAVGAAASLAVKHNTDTRSVNVKELQQLLKSIGAYLPNAD